MFNAKIILLLCCSVMVTGASCDEVKKEGFVRKNNFAQKATDSLHGYLALGELALLTSGRDGGKRAWHGVEGVLATTALTEVIKTVARRERPDGSNRKSFPSGHASSSFAMATAVAHYRPRMAWLAYGGAAVISWSRVELNRHYWHDVAAGAALGYFVTKQFVDERRRINPAPMELWQSNSRLPMAGTNQSSLFPHAALGGDDVQMSLPRYNLLAEPTSGNKWLFWGTGVGLQKQF